MARIALVLILAVVSVGSAQAAPSQPLARVSGQEVLVRQPVTALAADGSTAAFAFCNQLVMAWRLGGRALTPLGPAAMFTCPPPMGAQHVLSLAVAEGRVAWAVNTGGNTVDNIVFSADTGRPSAIVTAAQIVRCCRADPKDLPDQDRLGGVYGGGGLLVYGSRQKCGDPGAPECPDGAIPMLVSAAVWRLSVRTGQATQLMSSSEALEPVAARDGQVAVQRGNGTITVVDSSGRALRAFGSLAGSAVRGGVLTGGKLIALVPGKLLEFDVATGRQLAARALPNVSSAGPCGLPPCPTVALRLLDASHGLVAYLRAGKLHLLRLRDGRDVVVTAATDARFADGGLVYAYQAAGAWPGRVRFVPWSTLPLSP